jgi:hypothetical protein
MSRLLQFGALSQQQIRLSRELGSFMYATLPDLPGNS